MLRWAELIEQHTTELALLETLDMGKPIGDSSRIDIPAVANCIRWYAEAVDKVYDEVAPTGDDAVAMLVREPRSEEHTSELQSLMRISYAVFCLKKKKTRQTNN